MKSAIMMSTMQSVLQASVVSLVFLQFTQVSPFGIPGLSWGWGGGRQDFTKVVTPDQVVTSHELRYPFRQCSNGMEGLMVKVLLYPCLGERGRCQLNKGENVTLDVEFISNIPAESLMGSLSATSYLANWYTRGQDLITPLDLCASEHITCPIQPYHLYRYWTSFILHQKVPPIIEDTKITIRAANGTRNIACAVIPVEIMDPDIETRDGLLPFFYQRPSTTATI